MKLLRPSWKDMLHFGVKHAVPDNECGLATLQSRPYAGGPQIGQITFSRTSAVALVDAYSNKLQFPATLLMLTSVGPVEANAEDSILVHFKPLGKSYPTPGVITSNVTGQEPWFPFMLNYTGPVAFRAGTYIKLKPNAAIQEFWVDIGAEGTNTTGNYTFIYSNDIEEFYMPPRVSGVA